jgi:hypothetical protein
MVESGSVQKAEAQKICLWRNTRSGSQSQKMVQDLILPYLQLIALETRALSACK